MSKYTDMEARKLDALVAEKLDGFIWYAQGEWVGGKEDTPAWGAVRYLSRPHGDCDLCYLASGDEPVEIDEMMLPNYTADRNEAMRVYSNLRTVKRQATRLVLAQMADDAGWEGLGWAYEIAMPRDLCVAMLEADNGDKG